MSPCEALARSICARLRGDGFQAFLVGGCVRDLLLGLSPQDFDVATSATAEQVLALYPNARPVGAHFGVVLVGDGEAEVEVATFRSDSAYADGRHPDRVAFETDPRQDALRRDFTINALFLNPESDAVLDFTGGQADLRAGIIRAIGNPDDRFAEDHLRLLRAVRFAARFGYRIEPVTMEAIVRQHASIARISAERIRDELNRILVEGGARPGLELLLETGLLGVLLPEVASMQGVAQPPEYHPEGDVWTHVLLMLEQMRSPTVTLAWGVLLHDVGKPPTFRIADRIRFDGHAELGARMAVNILERLRFPRADVERVEMLVAQHLRFIDVPRMKPSTLKRFVRQPGFDELLELHRLDCASSHRRLETYEFIRAQLGTLRQDDLHPPRLLRGEDLIAAGYRPGPLFARILAELEDAQLDGAVFTREEALNLVRRKFPKEPVAPG